MPGYPIPFPKFRETDNAGNPLAGGKLYSYAAGTDTPLATYSNQPLTVPNENPTILDASGRASIWVEDGVAYKYVLKDPLDNIIWIQDFVQVPDIETAEIPGEVPTGAVIPFGGLAAPNGWLLCDGAAVSRQDYKDLWDVIGTTFGEGNGNSTFNVPDLRQRFPLGKAATGTGSVLGKSGGIIDHVHSGPDHTHTIDPHKHPMPHRHYVPHDNWSTQINTAPTPMAGLLQAGGSGVGGENSVSQANVDQLSGDATPPDTATVPLTTNAAGTGDTGPANPPFLAVLFIIKT
jgi:microcystin-dependent protein